MGDTKIQWHPGFVAAMNLEFMANRNDLEFESEHNLNTKPLEIDLLIIKKNGSAKIANEIGSFFKGHNIIEYKSPRDGLNIDVFYKCGAYAGLYKSYGRTLNERKAEDITVTIVREAKPRKLFEHFNEYGYALTKPYPGIYRIETRVWFPTQIVVTKELSKSSHIWLKYLSGNLREQEICDLMDSREELEEASDRELADSVLEVALEANRNVIEKWKGDVDMFESLMEIFEPQLQPVYERIRKEGMEKGIEEGMEIGMAEGLEKGIKRGMEEGMEKGMEKGIEKGIRGMIGALRDFGHGDAEIELAIVKNYGLSEAEAREYL